MWNDKADALRCCRASLDDLVVIVVVSKDGLAVKVAVVTFAFSPHGSGEERASAGAEMGVGMVDAVNADRGVYPIDEAVIGVKGVKGVVEVRIVCSCGVVPARERTGGEMTWFGVGSVAPWIGITKGARSLGDRAALGMEVSRTGTERGANECPDCNSSLDLYLAGPTGVLMDRS